MPSLVPKRELGNEGRESEDEDDDDDENEQKDERQAAGLTSRPSSSTMPAESCPLLSTG